MTAFLTFSATSEAAPSQLPTKLKSTTERGALPMRFLKCAVPMKIPNLAGL
jgi:hypothetical protein